MKTLLNKLFPNVFPPPEPPAFYYFKCASCGDVKQQPSPPRKIGFHAYQIGWVWDMVSCAECVQKVTKST